ncbi:MAG: non-canonical purine NTP pyrophosphatase [Actinobacteria bacterium]|nr:non-canonical purine NTP pyrophosphatase [Actinomycetota bacterium]
MPSRPTTKRDSETSSAEPIKARLASRNEHKLTELRAALPRWEIELLDADGYPSEEGETFYENARAKAHFGRGVTGPGIRVLGEDSGLEVDALDGGPGVRSNRWAAPGEDHVEKLLSELRVVEERHRGARYVCELVCVSPDGRELRGSGTLAGRIAEAPRGSEGFGYDPILIPEGEERTVAELGNEWKTSNSHRARAAAALLRQALED